MPRPPLSDLNPDASGAALVNWLFLDLNAYFASVEQQERPELRGRPIAVVPLITPNTVCIAASYEAKPFGVKTGVKLRDAQRLCPALEFVVARPPLYLDYHERILAAVETCLPVTSVLSIDEAACRLIGRERALPNALALAAAVKAALRTVGDTLRCSIGLAPNRYLGKVASDMQKPDGLTALPLAALPQALLPLPLTALPGIGVKTEARLHARGIRTMADLLALPRAKLGQVWGSVDGERLWDRLRGVDVDEAESPTKTIGRQHVLAPELRTRDGAFAVAQKLLHRAATELRARDLRAASLGVSVNFLGERARPASLWGQRPDWKADARIQPASDTFTLQAHLAQLWTSCPNRPPILVSVRLANLTAQADQPATLFDSGPTPQERATATMDALNQKYGALAVYPASLHQVKEAAPRRIGFGRPRPPASEPS